MFTRKCPKCGKELSYKNEYGLKHAKKTNRPCRSCARKGKSVGKGRKLSEEHKRNLSLAHKGKKLSEEHRRNISLRMKGNTNWKNKKHSEETRIKMSLSSGGDGILDKDRFNAFKLGAWSRRIRKRDGCCQKCNTTKNLEAHHIMPKGLFPDYVYDDWNGITLCNPCHIELHRQLAKDRKLPTLTTPVPS